MAWRTVVATLVDDATAAGEESVTIDLADLVELAAFSHVDQLPEVLRTRMAEGHVAGDILRYVVAFADHVPKHASVNKAIYAVCHQLKEDRAERRRRTASSRAWVRPTWSRFKCVAHLWAAYLAFMELANDAGLPDLHIVDASPESFLDFLAIAEWYRHRGEGLLPHAQTVPTLDPAATWRSPADLILPKLDISPSAPPAKILRVLDLYRAPKQPKALR